MTTFYILQDRVPVPVANSLEWGRWLETHFQERVVAQETIGSYWISTVFIGLDHRLFGEGPPLVFETIVTHESDELDWKERWPTWELASEGHRKALEFVRSKLS